MANEDGGGGTRLHGRPIYLRLVQFGPLRHDVVESAKNGSAPASTRVASRHAAAEDGFGGARGVACLGISGFTSTVAADLSVYDDGQIKTEAVINDVTVQQLMSNDNTTKFQRR